MQLGFPKKKMQATIAHCCQAQNKASHAGSKLQNTKNGLKNVLKCTKIIKNCMKNAATRLKVKNSQNEQG